MQGLAFTVARRLRESWSRVAVLVLALTIVTAPLELVLGPSLYPVDPRLAAQRMITLLAALGLVTVRSSGPAGRHRRTVAWAGVAGAGLALLASAVVLRAPLPVDEEARRHLAGAMGLATAAGVMVWGYTWSARPVWLSSLPGLLVGLLCPVLVAVQFPTGYLRSFLASVSQPYPLAVMAVWMLSAFAITCRLGLGRDGAASERLRAG